MSKNESKNACKKQQNFFINFGSQVYVCLLKWWVIIFFLKMSPKVDQKICSRIPTKSGMEGAGHLVHRGNRATLDEAIDPASMSAETFSTHVRAIM